MGKLPVGYRTFYVLDPAVVPNREQTIRSDALAPVISSLSSLQSLIIYNMPGRPNHSLDALENTEDSSNPFLSRLQRTTLLEDPFEEYDVYKQGLTLSDTARPLACLANAVTRFENPARVNAINIDAIPWFFWFRGLTLLLG